jgi:hypothetical protein
MMKSLKTLIGTLAVSLLCAGTATAERLKYGDYMPQGANEYSRTAEWMGNEINKRAAGKHSVTMLWGGTVVKVGEVPTAVENKIIDIGPLVTPYFPDQFPINASCPSGRSPRPRPSSGKLMPGRQSIEFAAELAKYKLAGQRPPAAALRHHLHQAGAHAGRLQGPAHPFLRIALPAMLEALGAVPNPMADVDGHEALSNSL